MKTIGVLHLITDTTLQTRFSHPELAEMALEGGADSIQFRQKSSTTRELMATAREMQILCERRSVPLIVNDRVDIALAVGSGGVHLGQDDLPVEIGRRLLPEEALIGASARSEEKILAAIAAGADYIGFGPIFATSSKADAEPPKGLEGLRRICEIAPCPVIAIGGIRAETACEVVRAGAHGVAVISAVCCQRDPRAATHRLVEEVQRAKLTLP